MKGYFSSLAKQSSVSIRGGQTSGARLPHAPMTETLAPLHSETILFVDSTPTTVRPIHESQTTEETSPQGISIHPPALIEGPDISNQGGSASLAPREISKTPYQTRPDETLRSVAPVENSLSIAKAPAVAIEDSFDPGASLAERPDVELEGQASKKGGVIRVGESESPIESKTESSRAGSRRDVPVATSIPHEYLEGIREWLDSPPIEIEESARRKTLQPSPESAFATVKERGQSTRPRLADPEVSPQNEIQEFSLSIGSISIVVEEPPAPKQQLNQVQPQTPSAVSPASPAHDAFALSRRYFRGF